MYVGLRHPRVFAKPLTSAFAVYAAIATAFSSSLISFLKPCPLWCHRQNGLQVFPCGCKFSNLHFSDTMKILSPQELWAASFLMWLQVFQLALAFDKMEILSPQDIPPSDPQLVPRRKYSTDSAGEAFPEGSFSQWEKGHQNCKSRG